MSEQNLYIDGSVCEHTFGGCECLNQMDSALKIVLQEGGAILFYSDSELEIDKNLKKINARALNSNKTSFIMRYFRVPQLKNKRAGYLILKELVRELALKHVRLISSTPSMALTIQELGAELIEWRASVTYEYGDKERGDNKR